MATWKKATAATTGVTVFINVDLVQAVFREKAGKSTTVRFAKDNKIDITEEPRVDRAGAARGFKSWKLNVSRQPSRRA
jgi:hypothetical protein